MAELSTSNTVRQELTRDEERDLLAKAHEGDQQAFASLARQAWGRMFSVCLSITGNRADAEDALQNALTSAWKNIEKIDGRARFSTWAYRICLLYTSDDADE